MARIRFRLINSEKLGRDLKRLPADLKKSLVQVGVKGATQLMEDALKDAAPVRTGKLRASVRTKLSDKEPWGWVGLKKAPGQTQVLNYYKTLVVGRKPHRRMGRPRRGSPQMANRWPFFRIVEENSDQVIDEMKKGAYEAMWDAAGKSTMIYRA